MNPTKEFRDYLISQGAALVGIGDLTAVPSSDYPVVLQSQSRYRNTSSKAFSLLQQENTTNLQFFERQTEHHRNCRCEIPD